MTDVDIGEAAGRVYGREDFTPLVHVEPSPHKALHLLDASCHLLGVVGSDPLAEPDPAGHVEARHGVVVDVAATGLEDIRDARVRSDPQVAWLERPPVEVDPLTAEGL